MQILLENPSMTVSYGSASVVTDESVDRSDLGAPWADESNGLCGAGIPGLLELQVGTHTGWVPFRIELHESEPSLASHWEEAVEVSFTTTHDEAYLLGLMDDKEYRFPLPAGDYRVRYCARGFDEAHRGEEGEDSYLLQFWPQPPCAARILRQTSSEAAYWHRARRTLTPQEQEEDDLREAAERENRARERWGDRVPNERLRATLDQGLWSGTLMKLDPDLEFALAEADDTVHRRIAAWAALRCADVSGLNRLSEFAPAFAALRRDEPVPTPFDDPGECWALYRRTNAPRTIVPMPLEGAGPVFAQDWAIPALFFTAHADSLVAVLEVVVCLAHVHGRDGYRQAFADLRARFPELPSGGA
ncbi:MULTISPECIES: hypothetical protein [Microbacterium]|uniref:hypothetical protein n=1 Tax=Microbacterium TaxID=33882 RepID=UPI00277D54D1|nr:MULTISPECIES: hypothetical protein [Microbacterium]MDQ1075477.1 hypothetical protein [Microbacterium sp. SORGH_AS_0969]MDQ1115711.1 hypothetical protein [Microbacterium testaceum]